MKRQGLLIGVIYFLILLGIALWARDIPDQPDAFSLTLQKQIKWMPLGDPTSFLKGAIDIAENRWISSANEWILNLWPPGFILLEALIIKATGSETHVILALQILAAMLFSAVLLLLHRLLNEYMDRGIAFLLPLLIFAFPVSRVFLLEPRGIIMGESFSIGFFLLGTLLAFHSVARESLRYAVYAGLCLALSAYFRSQFEIILLALTACGGGLALAIQLTRLKKTIDPRITKTSIKTITLVIIVAHVSMVPWRAYHWINQGSPLWVYTSDLSFRNSVMSTEYLQSVHGGFVAAGAGNLVCRIEPSTCGDTANAKKLFIRTFIAHPLEWYSFKFDVIGKYWFSSLQNFSVISVQATFWDLLTNGIFLIALVFVFLMLFTKKLRSHELWPLLMWVTTSLILAYALIITVHQFETRYFYFPKIVSITLSLLVFSLYFRSNKKESRSSKIKETF